jgi:hypothetical protein
MFTSTEVICSYTEEGIAIWVAGEALAGESE